MKRSLYFFISEDEKEFDYFFAEKRRFQAKIRKIKKLQVEEARSTW